MLVDIMGDRSKFQFSKGDQLFVERLNFSVLVENIVGGYLFATLHGRCDQNTQHDGDNVCSVMDRHFDDAVQSMTYDVLFIQQHQR